MNIEEETFSDKAAGRGRGKRGGFLTCLSWAAALSGDSLVAAVVDKRLRCFPLCTHGAVPRY